MIICPTKVGEPIKTNNLISEITTSYTTTVTTKKKKQEMALVVNGEEMSVSVREMLMLVNHSEKVDQLFANLAANSWNNNAMEEIVLNINEICDVEVLFTGASVLLELLMGRPSDFDYEQCSVRDILLFLRKLQISPDVILYLLQRVKWGRMAHARSIGFELVIGDEYADIGRLILKHCTVDYSAEDQLGNIIVEMSKLFPVLFTEEISLVEYFNNRNTSHVLCPACVVGPARTITHEWARLTMRTLNG